MISKFGYEFRRTFVNAFFDAGYRGRLISLRSGLSFGHRAATPSAR